jgi:hypothetical protein
MRRLALAALALVVTACEANAVAPTTVTASTTALPATVDDLRGEWRAEPLIVSEAALQEMDEDCLAAFPLFPPGLSRVVADARGEGRIQLVYAREDRQHAVCEAIVRSDGFQVEPRSASAEPVTDPPLAPTEIRPHGGGSSPGGTPPGERWYGILGEAGSEIHQVVAHVTGLPPVVASLGGGWFSLWWPVEDSEYRLVGLDAAGNEVAYLYGP